MVYATAAFYATAASKPHAERGHIRVRSLDMKTSPSYHDDSFDKSQVVAVGTALPTLNMPASSLQNQVMVGFLQIFL